MLPTPPVLPPSPDPDQPGNHIPPGSPGISGPAAETLGVSGPKHLEHDTDETKPGK